MGMPVLLEAKYLAGPGRPRYERLKKWEAMRSRLTGATRLSA
jgi:hypothetical protein